MKLAWAVSGGIILILTGVPALAKEVAPTVGDAKKGETIFNQRCAVCHSFGQGPAVIGPNLSGVVGRTAGSFAGFNYTSAMKKYKARWTKDTLDKFLVSPGATVPGTAMPVSLSDARERADLIAYLGGAPKN